MKTIYLLSLLVAGMLLLGCTPSSNSVLAPIHHENVIIQDAKVHDLILIDSVQEKNNIDLLEIQVQGKNIANKDIEIAYKIDWHDKGFKINTIMSRWVVLKVEANRSFVIKGISPSKNATGYAVQVSIPSKNDEKRKNSYTQDFQYK